MKLRQVTVSIAIVATLVIGIFGCGGSSTSFATTDKAAVYSNSVASHQSLQGGLNVGFVSLKDTAPAGSGLHMSTQFAQAFFNSKRPKVSTPPTETKAAALSFLPFLGLYYRVSTNANVETISYFTDAAGTAAAGSMTITMVGLSTFSTSYSSYPQTIQTTANITGGKIPMNGSLTIVYQDNAGANTMQGTLTLPNNNISINLNLGLSHAQNSSGTCTITTPTSTFTLSNVTGNPFATMTGNVAITPNNWTGTGSLTPSSGLFSMDLTTPQGHATAVLGTDGKLVVTYPDGTGNTVTDPSGASLNLPTTGSTTSTTSTTSTATSSSTSTTAGTYADPVTFVSTTSNYTLLSITGVSQTGHAVGQEYTNGSTLQPVFWPTPTTPTAMQVPSGTGVSVELKGVNSNDEIVGDFLSQSQSRMPVYYASPTAAPTPLKVPNNTTAGVAMAINASGAIVGWYDTVGGSQVGAYWANKDATPVALPTGAFGIDQEADFIDDAGEIFGDDTSKWMKWSNSTATPVQMNPGTGSTQAYVTSVTPGGVAVGGYLKAGNLTQPGFWPAGSTAVTDSSYVSGFNNATIDRMNAAGDACGYQRDASNVVTAWVKVGTSFRSVKDLVTHPGTGSFYEAKFIDANSNLYALYQSGNNFSWVYLKKN